MINKVKKKKYKKILKKNSITQKSKKQNNKNNKITNKIKKKTKKLKKYKKVSKSKSRKNINSKNNNSKSRRIKKKKKIVGGYDNNNELLSDHDSDNEYLLDVENTPQLNFYFPPEPEPSYGETEVQPGDGKHLIYRFTNDGQDVFKIEKLKDKTEEDYIYIFSNNSLEAYESVENVLEQIDGIKIDEFDENGEQTEEYQLDTEEIIVFKSIVTSDIIKSGPLQTGKTPQTLYRLGGILSDETYDDNKKKIMNGIHSVCFIYINIFFTNLTMSNTRVLEEKTADMNLGYLIGLARTPNYNLLISFKRLLSSIHPTFFCFYNIMLDQYLSSSSQSSLTVMKKEAGDGSGSGKKICLSALLANKKIPGLGILKSSKLITLNDILEIINGKEGKEGDVEFQLEAIDSAIPVYIKLGFKPIYDMDRSWYAKQFIKWFKHKFELNEGEKLSTRIDSETRGPYGKNVVDFLTQCGLDELDGYGIVILLPEP